MRDTPSNTDDVIDSRDVIARIEELEGERESAGESAYESPDVEDMYGFTGCDSDCYATENEAIAAALAEWDASSEGQELKTLKSLADQGEGYGDWGHGETLIRESYFQNYAQELAEDCGMIPKDNAWPCTCIDWEQACRELKVDYTEVDFDGVSYFMRA